MTDELNTKLATLNARVAERQQQRREARQAAWAKVQADYPDSAAFISAMAAKFGKPKMLVVVDAATSEKILDTRTL